MTIGLIDVDSKIPNLALMKISSYYKDLGEKVDPFVMIYNQKDDKKLKHFARWVNSRIYKSYSFSEYEPWIKSQSKYPELNLI